MKLKALVYGYGNSYQKNIYWINQLYNIVGVTDAKIMFTDKEKREYKVEDAVKLDFDIVLVSSVFFDEIKKSLIDKFHINATKIYWFIDEFSKERYETFGEKNPDIIFYVFRAHWQESKNGFYNFFSRVMASYYEVSRQGYKLVVDMKNYYTEYAGLERYGIINIWEDYYEQPSSYTLEEVYQSKNVILSKFDDKKYNYPDLSNKIYLSNIWWIETCQNLSRLYKLTPNHMLKENISKERVCLKVSGKILRVLARGTDYISLKPKNHPVPYDIECFIEECQNRLLNKTYDYLYLATEDLDILNIFKKIFGEKLLYIEQMRMKQNVNRVIMDIKFGRENDNYLRGLEYCTAIEILAKCDGLLANCCCYGALGAILINGGHYMENIIFDAGRYD